MSNQLSRLNRKCIQVAGSSAASYLQGLITNQINNLNLQKGMFTVFLNPKGRILTDAFIYKTEEDYVIEVDSRAVDTLVKHMEKYILRSKVKLKPLDINVYHSWDNFTDPASIILQDPRNHQMGYRILSNSILSCNENDTSYLLKRIQLGIPEGVDDLVENVSLPLECNFDLLNGIDFRKGCYLGQELTIRTHHTGVIRKRILPIQVIRKGEDVGDVLTYIPGQNRFNPKEEILFENKPKSVGRTGSCLGNVGLGLVKLEHCDPQLRLHLPNGDRANLLKRQLVELETRLNKQIISLEQQLQHSELELKIKVNEVTNLEASNKLLFQQSQELNRQLQEIKENENGEIANLRKQIQDKERMINKLKDEKLDIPVPKFQLEKIYVKEEPKIIYKTETVTVKEKDPDYEKALQKVADYQHLTRKLETELSNLRSENAFLKSIQTKSAKLIEENNSLSFKLKMMDNFVKELEETKLKLSNYDAERQEFERALQENSLHNTSPFGLVQILGQKQREIFVLNDQLSSCRYEKTRMEETVNSKRLEITELQTTINTLQQKLDQVESSSRRMQTAFKIKDQEIQFLKNSFGSEISLSNEEIIESYKKQVAEYEQLLLFKEQQFVQFENQKSIIDESKSQIAQLKKQLEDGKNVQEEYKSQMSVVTNSLEQYKNELHATNLNQIEKEKEIEKLNQELDHYLKRLGNGEYNPDNIKVLSLKNSPENLLRMNYVNTIESLRLENQELRSSSSSRVSEKTVNSLNMQINELEEELHNRETKIKRLKQEFGRRVQEYKKYVYFMLGYKIEFPEDGSCRLYSIYSREGDPHFKLVPNDADQDGGELFIIGGDPEMQRYTKELKEYYVDEYNSMPALLNSFTVHLFNEINNIED
ncbi:ccr4 associated factor [Boothiomyces macroporosus]|uniref:Ccr4 associated factor n=1 Tax=Boothiomyces macroporosus TaxID=261099 RepID=A0AAD5UDV9_9FUNG|nr:ccr4 associated factor [Boothiomyces macroporosus]